MTTGSGALVRSPIMSCSNCGNSTSSTGSAALTLARTSAITSSPVRLRFDQRFSLTEISPVLASVTAARPSCRPVRREVPSTSGTWRRICFHVGNHAVGLFERRAGGHDVVDDETAFVHGGQQVGPAIAVTEIGAADQQNQKTASNSGCSRAKRSTRS
jgi:hypothetical protein